VIEKPQWQADLEAKRVLFKRRANAWLGWIVYVLYSAVTVFVAITMIFRLRYSRAILIVWLVVICYGVVVGFISLGVAIYRSRNLLDATEWMKRGGLMASPTVGFHADESGIRAALRLMPSEVASQVGDEVESYLAMPDGDEKQLCRDRLIREFYRQAGSPSIEYSHRTAYNALRRAISPWAHTDADD
jgi:hypothetical protein